MLIITITNCILIVIAFFIEDTEILDIFSLLDTIFLIFYSLECLIKIIAVGINNYFDDGWYIKLYYYRNVFDVSLVIL